MKVHALKKINEYAKINNISLDYERLLNIDIYDTNAILAYIDVNNKNVETVIDFMMWEFDNHDWKNNFNHLKGIESFDIREYIITKLVSATSKDKSKAILRYFDFEKLLYLFKDIEEWKKYIESINETMKVREDLCIENIEFILQKTTDYSYRCDLIEHVMEYSQRGDFDPTFLSEYIDKENINYIDEILPLLAKGYDLETTLKLFTKFQKDKDETIINNSHIRSYYGYVLTYLNQSKLFNQFKDNKSLIEIFNETNFLKYNNMVLILKKIEENEDNELFEHCLKNPYILTEPKMNEYIDEITAEKDSKDDYRKSLLYVLDNVELVDNEFGSQQVEESIITKSLALSQLMDGSSMEMAKFITKVPCLQIMIGIEINENNQNTREVIYNDFPKFIKDKQFTLNEIIEYTDWLKRLSILPADICQKVMNIINIPLIKNMDIEEQKQIKELVLNEENYKSLDYIHTIYKEKEECDPEVKLVTVTELLDSDHDINKVLEGFDDDEEITPKTLIRSMEYKKN